MVQELRGGVYYTARVVVYDEERYSVGDTRLGVVQGEEWYKVRSGTR